MKPKARLLCLLLFCSCIGFGQNVGIGTTTPDPSAKLQVSSPNKGIMIPLIALDSATDITHVPSPATGLIIFNTRDTAYSLSVSPYTYIKLTRGLYFWNGAKWQPGGGADNIWSRYNYLSNPGTIVPVNTADLLYDENYSGFNFLLGNRKVSIIGPGIFGGTALWVQNPDTTYVNPIAISAHVRDNSVSYYSAGGTAYGIESISDSKKVGGGFFFTDSAIAIRAWSPGGTGGFISSTIGKGLVVSTQDSSLFFSNYNYGNNNSIGLDLMANSTIANPNLMIRENDNDYARVTFKNNTGNNYWTLAGYNNNTLSSESFNVYNSRYGDIMRYSGDGNVRVIGKDITGSPVYGNAGKMSITHISGISNPQLALIELDSTSFCRQLFKTNTVRNDNFWSLAASSNNVLDPERFYVNNSRLGNILGIAGNGTMALNKDPTYAATNDATLQIKANSVRDIFRLETNASSNNWSWWIDGSNNMEYFYNGSFKGSWSSSSGIYTASDRRLKKNIQPINGVLTSVLQLQPVSYQMIDDSILQRNELGFIAQDVETLFPQLVSDVVQRENKPSLKSLNYSGFGVLAIKAIQEQQQIIDQQQKQINSLIEQIASIKNLLSKNNK